MKSSNNSNNDTEEVIELLSQNVIPHHPVDIEHAEFIIQAEVTSVIPDSPEATAAYNLNDNDAVGTSSYDGLRHGTTQDLDALPEIIRHLSWNDSFYESSHDVNDIIMAFDIDRTKYDQCLLPLPVGICFYIILIILCLMFFDQLPFVSFCLALSGLVNFIFGCNQRANQFRAKRMHICLTRNGIYIDKVDLPGGHNLMMRDVIPYKSIYKCRVIAEYNCWTHTEKYNVAIHRSEGENVFATTYNIDDLARPQQFVDVVNAMKEKSTIPPSIS